MKQNVIVSLADSNYFPLLDELINSVKRFKENSNVAICILDAGLTKKQKEILSLKVDEIKSAEWDIEVPAIKVKGKEWLKSQVSRAFLPKYFQILMFEQDFFAMISSQVNLSQERKLQYLCGVQKLIFLL